MKIFKYKNTGGIANDESQLTRLAASVSNGLATIHRRIYFEAENANEDAMDILSLKEFPAKYAAHPRHAAFKYYGNAEIQPLSENSKYWMADLEYSTTDPNATDEDGGTITSETKPWKLKPDNIQFTYPEVVVPFTASYNSTGYLYDKNGNAVLPVRNSAGDRIPAERAVRNVQMSFTFATQSWNINNALKYGNSINSQQITVCGLSIPQYTGLLLPPECSYITVYEDGSTKVKWQYWSVTVNIQIDTTGLLLYRRMLDVGDRAKFKEIDLSADAMLAAAKSVNSRFANFVIKADSKPSQICHFRLNEAVTYGNSKKLFYPTGKLMFCSWNQYLAARRLYLIASEILMRAAPPQLDHLYELSCEQDTQMPLDKGYLLTKAIDGHADYVANTPYNTLVFREYPVKSWSGLNLPTKGMKW